MEKDRDKTYNGSYLYRLNQELSGQQELDPYFITSAETGDDEALIDDVTEEEEEQPDNDQEE